MGKTTLLYLSMSEAFIPSSLSGGGPAGAVGGGGANPRNKNISVLTRNLRHKHFRTELRLELQAIAAVAWKAEVLWTAIPELLGDNL